MSKKFNKTEKARITARLNAEIKRLEMDLLADENDIREIRSEWQERDSPSEDLLRDVEWFQYETIQEQTRLAKFAIDKLETGQYGICEKCGEEINKERLEAIPSARFCIICQSETESVTEATRLQTFCLAPRIY